MKTAASLHRAGTTGRSSFTLVEMLVSIAVLSFILALLAGTMGLTNSAYSKGFSRIDNFAKSRTVLDTISRDLQRGVFRPDLPAFGTGSQYITNNGVAALANNASTNAFYTRSPGVGNNVRDISLIIYTLAQTNAVLQRSDCAIPWTPAGDWSGYLPFGGQMDGILPQAEPRQIAQGIIDFELTFRLQDGTLSKSYGGFAPANPVVSVGIDLAVVDDQTLKVLSQDNLTSLHAKFTTSFAQNLQAAHGIKAGWDTQLMGGFFAGYPKPLDTGLKTFERWVPCLPPF